MGGKNNHVCWVALLSAKVTNDQEIFITHARKHIKVYTVVFLSHATIRNETEVKLNSYCSNFNVDRTSKKGKK
jgi:hypothetical protein